jgi:gamma-glutamyl phosphate reductase
MATPFTASNIGYIINTIEDLLITMDSSQPLKISTVDSFVALYFSLKNGNVEIEIHDDEAFCRYKDNNGENVKNTKFYQRYLSDAMSHESLYIALKEIRDFDRQHMSEAMISNISLDRASFGLAEVN